AVAPRAAGPAAASAAASACGPPSCACQPSPTTAPPGATSTQPTSGLGETRPRPRPASSKARRMYALEPALSAGSRSGSPSLGSLRSSRVSCDMLTTDRSRAARILLLLSGLLPSVPASNRFGPAGGGLRGLG